MGLMPSFTNVWAELIDLARVEGLVCQVIVME